MYGGFIATRDGVKLLEYNARFGDPRSDEYSAAFENRFRGGLPSHYCGNTGQTEIEFENKATVANMSCPKATVCPPIIRMPRPPKPKSKWATWARRGFNYSSVDQKEDGLYLSSSRAIGIVGMADTLAEARKITEEGVKAVKGPVAYREDIGTDSLIQKRVDHIKRYAGIADLFS